MGIQIIRDVGGLAVFIPIENKSQLDTLTENDLRFLSLVVRVAIRGAVAAIEEERKHRRPDNEQTG